MRRGATRDIGLRAAILSLLLLASSAAAGDSRNRAAGAVARGGAAAAVCAQRALLDGTFVQLTSAAAARPRSEWQALFDDARALGLEQVFVQWTLADGVRFYPAPPGVAGEDAAREEGAEAAASGRTVETLLELAAARGMRLWVGLAHDPGWWTGIDRSRPPGDVEVFLARRRLQNVAVAREIAPLVATHPAFAGWYVPDEIDDRNWLGDERRTLVAAYLTELGEELRDVAPSTTVAVSGFGQGWATPAQLAEQWSAILAGGGVDLLLFQDGVGAGKLSLADLEIYLPPLASAVGAAGRRLGVVVELFASSAGAADANGPVARPAADPAAATPAGAVPGFRAAPAQLDRVERQLVLAKRFARGPLVGFSVPDYMSPFGGAEAATLYTGYRALVARCTGADPR